eukprot:Nitzschia sp. Nitz4//scaffold369_size34440//15032//16747//NITZ4_007842-RA/size34440-processed-gene-0.24-mRNA-1//-1//CDS//3329549365//2875//frame0
MVQVHVLPDKETLSDELCSQILRCCEKAIQQRGAFSIALSGGSLPQLLAKLAHSKTNPHFHAWHVLLADERCVPADHPDSNLRAIRRAFLDTLPNNNVPHNQIYDLDQVSLAESVEIAADSYARKVHTALSATGGKLDLAVLGFGPDGHTCSLFPGHPLVTGYDPSNLEAPWVAPIKDSPKPPSRRITLTLTLLNHYTRTVLFCGAGDSKSPILKDIFVHGLQSTADEYKFYHVQQLEPKYPCAMVQPPQEDADDNILYLVDQAAMKDVPTTALPPSLAHSIVVHELLVASSKANVPRALCPLLVQYSMRAIAERGAFTIALSGGSLPSQLAALPEYFAQQGITDPQWNKWHVLLADERCVPNTHSDSNLLALQTNLLNHIGIPSSQVYGLDESALQALLASAPDQRSAANDAVALAYEKQIKTTFAKFTGDQLDMAVLGFGPDGHTCSLFPTHSLLAGRTDDGSGQERWVLGIEDSPKPPPERITLTFHVLNKLTRNIIVVGTGSSKQPITKQVFGTALKGKQTSPAAVAPSCVCYEQVPVQASAIATLPVSMVKPNDRLIWVLDSDALP